MNQRGSGADGARPAVGEARVVISNAHRKIERNKGQRQIVAPSSALQNVHATSPYAFSLTLALNMRQCGDATDSQDVALWSDPTRDIAEPRAGLAFSCRC